MRNPSASALRGIKVLDDESGLTIPNKPFLHNALLGKKDADTHGSLRKLARLLKSLKADSDTPPDISSYDICALVYGMPAASMMVPAEADLLLIRNCRDYLRQVRDSPEERALLQVPNGMRMVFGPGGATLAGLTGLTREIEDLVDDIEAGLSRSFRKLAEARIRY